MGRAKRERRERIQAGLEQPMVRKAVVGIGRQGIIRELSKGSVDDQMARLAELREQGVLPQSNFRDSILNNAPREMDKGIKKFLKEGKPVTIDTLCAEARNSQSFRKMCADVGINLAWFERLAQERMEAHGL